MRAVALGRWRWGRPEMESALSGGRIVSMLLPTSSRPQLMRVSVAEPPVGLFIDDPAVAREVWQRRLSMMPDANGEPVAVLP